MLRVEALNVSSVSQASSPGQPAPCPGGAPGHSGAPADGRGHQVAQHRYLIMTGIRVICVAVAVYAARLRRLVLEPAVGAILIPYIAVVFASGGREPGSVRCLIEHRMPLPPRQPAADSPAADSLRFSWGSSSTAIRHSRQLGRPFFLLVYSRSSRARKAITGCVGPHALSTQH